ncbi:MAG TPA: hypothetical protein VN822_06430 [Candidatus Acidoferrales bacterium]|nr:hypothetical protein [Candidatus Acidoferrales bacterium]
MSRRTEIYLLVGLAVVLAAVLYFRNRSDVPGIAGVFAADTKFVPLDVQEPQLRLDQLEKLRKLEYSGSHRNIFVAAPPPVAKPAGRAMKAPEPFVGPMKPPPPPPLQVPGEFFGYAAQPDTGRKFAFFTSGDDVFVVAEGDTFLNNFRVVHIGNDSADVEEISTGRRATVPMTQPPNQASNP